MALFLGVCISYLGASGAVKTTIEDVYYQQLQKIFVIAGGLTIFLGGCVILYSCIELFSKAKKK